MHAAHISDGEKLDAEKLMFHELTQSESLPVSSTSPLTC